MAVDPQRLTAIQDFIRKDKVWAGSSPMSVLWTRGNKKRLPKPWSFRAALEADGATVEGLFVEVWYQPSRILGARPTLQMTLLVDSTRATAVDDNGPASGHLNKVGAGLPFFQKVVGVPHIHFCVPDALIGYAEPLPQMTPEDLWTTFLSRANISGAPGFELPPGQLEMPI